MEEAVMSVVMLKYGIQRSYHKKRYAQSLDLFKNMISI